MGAVLIFVLGAVLGGFAVGAIADWLELSGTVSTILIGVWVVVLLSFGGVRASQGR